MIAFKNAGVQSLIAFQPIERLKTVQAKMILPRDTGHRVKDLIIMIQSEVLDEKTTQEPQP